MTIFYEKFKAGVCGSIFRVKFTHNMMNGFVMAESRSELVVLLGADRQPVGTALKSEVHTADTPLHLAFSCWVLDDDGRVLLTRRALSKRTWPGVWTNSFCGHPGPGESMAAALRRRAEQELGLELAELREVVPEFAYWARDASGVVENEFCPVWTARAESSPVPNPEEVAESLWVDPAELLRASRAVPQLLSPWLNEELSQPGLLAALDC